MPLTYPSPPPQGATSTTQALGHVGLAVLGMAIASFMVVTARNVDAALPWGQALACRLMYLLGGGGLAACVLVLAWRGLQGPSDPSLPARLRRLCPGCGRLAPARTKRAPACPRCGMPVHASAWVAAPGQRMALSVHVVMAMLVGSALCFAVLHGLRFLEPGHPGLEALQALLGGVAGLVGLIGVLHGVRNDWRVHRSQRTWHFQAGQPVHSLSLAGNAWVDRHGQLERAEGSSSWEITTPLHPVPVASLGADRARVLRLLARLEWRRRIVVQRVRTLSWQRLRPETAAAEPSGYRGGIATRAWTCTEQHAVEVRIDWNHDPGYRLTMRLAWPAGQARPLDELVDRLERDRALFDAVARLGRRTGSQPDPDPATLQRRIGELAVLTTR